MANILPIVVKNKPVNKTVFMLTRIVTKKENIPAVKQDKQERRKSV